MHRLNDFFPHKICINLDRRPDRWRRVRSRFELHGIRDVHRAAAVDGAAVAVPSDWRGGPGAFGCLQSHLAAVRRAQRDRLPSLLIFEDDVECAPDFNGRFERSASRIPDHWDMLFLGGSHRRQPDTVAAEIARLRGTLATHAYALRHTVYESFIALNSGALDVLDANNVRLQKTHRCYGFFPNLAWQEAGYSDVAGAAVDPWTIKESLVANSAAVEQMLKQTAVVLAYRAGDSQTGARNRRNLLFLVRSYLSLVPASAIAVLQLRDVARTVGESKRPVDLPAGCRFVAIAEEDPQAAWKAGLSLFGGSFRFFVFGKGDLDIRPGQVQAALQMCQRYGCVSTGSSVRLMDEDETARLVTSQGSWLPPERMGRLTRPRGDQCCVVTRAAAAAAGFPFAWHPNAADSHIFEPQMTVWHLNGWPTPGRRLP